MAINSQTNVYTVRNANFFLGKLPKALGYQRPAMRDIGNVKDVVLSFNVGTIEATDNFGGVAATRITTKSGELSLSLRSTSMANYELGLLGDLTEMAAVVSEEFELPAMKTGGVIPLQANLTSVTLEGLVEDEDYSLRKGPGMLVALKDIATPTKGTYSASVTVGLGILTNNDGTYRIVIDASQECGQIWTLHRAVPLPVDSLSFNSETEAFADINIKFQLQADENAPYSDVMGRIGFVQYVDSDE